jgi:hypothetical protein
MNDVPHANVAHVGHRRILSDRFTVDETVEDQRSESFVPPLNPKDPR